MNAFLGCCEHFVLHFLTLSLQVCTKLGRELGGTFALVMQYVFLEYSLRNGAVGAKAHGLLWIGKNNPLVTQSFQYSKGQSRLHGSNFTLLSAAGRTGIHGRMGEERHRGGQETDNIISLLADWDAPEDIMSIFLCPQSSGTLWILALESEFSESNRLLYWDSHSCLQEMQAGYLDQLNDLSLTYKRIYLRNIFVSLPSQKFEHHIQ